MTGPAPTVTIGRGVLHLIATDPGLRRQVRAMAAAAGAGVHVDVPLEVDSRGFVRDLNGRLHDMRGRYVAEGRASGRAYAQSLRGSFSSQISRAGGLLGALNFIPIPPQLLAITAAAGPAIAVVLGLASSLGMAATSAAALAPALLGVIGIVGAGMLAFKSLETVTTPAGKAFQKQLDGMKTGLTQLQKTAQTATLPGFTAALKDIYRLLPDANIYIRTMGAELGRTVQNLAAYVSSPIFRSQLGVIMKQNSLAARAFADSMGPIAGIFGYIAMAASPLVKRLAEAWLAGSRLVFNWIQLRAESGQLAAYFQAAGDAMATWFRIVKNVVVGVVNILAAANPAGSEMASSLETITKKFAEWTGSEQGQEALKAFFNFIMNIDYARIFAVASAVAAVAAAAKMLGAVQGLGGIVMTLGSLGPIGLGVLGAAAAVLLLVGAVAYLYTQSSEARDTIKGLVAQVKDQLGPAFTRISDFITQRVGPAFKNILIGRLRELANFMSETLIPAVKKSYEEYLPKLEKAWDKIAKSFKENKQELQYLWDIFKSVVSWVVSTAIPMLGSFAGFIVTRVAGAISFVTDTIGVAVRTVKRIGAAFGEVRDTAQVVWEYIRDLIRGVWDGISDRARQVGDTIRGVFTGIYDTVSGVVMSIVGFVLPIVQAFVGMVGAILNILVQVWVGAFNWIDQATGGFFTNIYNTVAGWMTSLWTFLGSAMAWIGQVWDMGWGWVTTATSNAWNWIVGIAISTGGALRTAVSTVMGAVSGFFRNTWDTIRGMWDTAWSWIFNTANNWAGRLRDAVTGIRDHIVGVFRAIPRAIVGAINGLIDLINGAINQINRIAPDIPKLGHVDVPQGFAYGGRIRGKGTGTSDSIPIMASDGEFMIRSAATSALERTYGTGFLKWLNTFDISGDPSAFRERRRYAGGGLISRTQNFIKSTDPLPYVFGAVGPDAYDCSGLVGEVWARLTGHPSYRRNFLTYDLPGAGGFTPGRGLYTIGLSQEHVVGNLAGLAFEAASSESGIKVGAAATDVNQMPNQYYLPSFGEMFIPGGNGAGGADMATVVRRIVDAAIGPIRGQIGRLTGDSKLARPILGGLLNSASTALRSAVFDQGGILGVGQTLAVNNTGRPEAILPPELLDRLAAGGGDVFNFADGAFTLDLSKVKTVQDLIDLLDGIKTSARQLGGRATTRSF